LGAIYHSIITVAAGLGDESLRRTSAWANFLISRLAGTTGKKSPALGYNTTDMSYSGKIGSRTITAGKPVIVFFGDGQVLEFTDRKEAEGFVRFYSQNQTAKSRNPARTYFFEAGKWIEDGA
jgi:hypothetical protein